MLHHNAAVTVSFQSPDRFVNLFLAEYLPWMHGKKCQNVKLGSCQTNLLPVAADTPLIVPDGKALILRLLFLLPPPLFPSQVGHYSGTQFIDGKRFGYIIISTKV